MNRPPDGVQDSGAVIVWPRSGVQNPPDQTTDLDSGSLPSVAGEVERILRDYACECYAIGRGESMYYLVEDLPRLARAATEEVMAIRPDVGLMGWKAALTAVKSAATNTHPRAAGARKSAASSRLAVMGGSGVTKPLPGASVPGNRPPELLLATAERGAKSFVAVLPIVAILAVLGLAVITFFAL